MVYLPGSPKAQEIIGLKKCPEGPKAMLQYKEGWHMLKYLSLDAPLAEVSATEDVVAFYDIGRGRAVMVALREQKVLRYVHPTNPSFEVRLNPQCNRFSTTRAVITERVVMDYIMSQFGSWYIVPDSESGS